MLLMVHHLFLMSLEMAVSTLWMPPATFQDISTCLLVFQMKIQIAAAAAAADGFTWPGTLVMIAASYEETNPLANGVMQLAISAASTLIEPRLKRRLSGSASWRGTVLKSSLLMMLSGKAMFKTEIDSSAVSNLYKYIHAIYLLHHPHVTRQMPDKKKRGNNCKFDNPTCSVSTFRAPSVLSCPVLPYLITTSRMRR